MKTYELTYIVSPEIKSEEAEAKGKEIEAAITSREGTVLKQTNPVAKTFSYPIGKKASGFLGILEFQLEPEKLLELKEVLAKDEKIIRDMVVIKRAAEFKKERRTRTKIETATEEIKIEEPVVVEKAETVEEEAVVEPKVTKVKEKEKVELKDIEHELDEILG
ncbi:MAG: 30S ribosomal protein S6 [Candidatus Staskawiczbacteria bacterium]